MRNVIAEPVTEKMVRPARRWRNKWLVTRAFRCQASGEALETGDVYEGVEIHPSKEVAEQKALDGIAKSVAKFGQCLSEHLGAFPVTP